MADDIAIVRSMHTDQFNHAPAQIFLNSGSPLPGRPSMGSWVTYGLGTEADDLPAFVVLATGTGKAAVRAANWSNGFLPGMYAGVPFRSTGDPILYVSNPPGIDNDPQRESIDLIQKLNSEQFQTVGDPQIATRISSYETAYRMQSRALSQTDLSQESRDTLEMYGVEPGNRRLPTIVCWRADSSSAAFDS